MTEKTTVIGAGLVGSLQALILARQGFEVDVFEARGDIRDAEIISGRSINLALSDRGWKALDIAGISDQIHEIAIPMKGRLMHSPEGDLSFQPYGKDGQAIYSVSRGELNRLLILEADKHDHVNMHFDMRCTDIDLKTNEITFENTKSGEEKKVSGGKIFGTDGVFSRVRWRLQRTPRFDFSQTYMNHGYKELTIKANEDGTHKMETNALHIWPRGKFMLIALPNLDGSFTVTLFMPFEGENSFETLTDGNKVKSFFEETFPDALGLMPNLEEDFFENPTSYLCYVKCFPWNYEDKIVLMGDASHAIVPFYGQGMNAGFEDCSVLFEIMQNMDGNWQKAFSDFSQSRKENGDAILDLALSNYIEMRDLVADPEFLLRKKIEKKVSAKYPNKWMPLYEMVTFSHLPYSEALKQGKKQRAIMDQIMNDPDIENKWDSEEVESRMLSLLDDKKVTH